VDVDPAANEIGGDIRLKIGEGQDEIARPHSRWRARLVAASQAAGPAARKCLSRNVSTALKPGQDNGPEHRARWKVPPTDPLPISATMLRPVSAALT
jgi:hypothetical protein